jgi:Tol biopolymer transport system component
VVEANDEERFVIDLSTGRERVMDESIPSDDSGLLSPDGTRYAHYTNDAKGGRVIFVQPVDSLTRPRIVARTPQEPWFSLSSWTPDGKALLAVTGGPGKVRILRIDVEGDGEPTDSLEAEIEDLRTVNPSPDGTWIALEQVDEGSRHVLIAPAGRLEEAVRVSDVSSGQTRWRADGRELFFLTEAGTICSVSIETDDSGEPHINAAVPLFDIDAEQYSGEVYSVSPDGQRILVVEPIWRDRKQEITLMTDWLATLKQ